MTDVNEHGPVNASEPPDDGFVPGRSFEMPQDLKQNDKSSEPFTQETYAFPASFAQQRLWFLDKLEPGNSLYNVPFAARIRGRLHVELMENSFRQLISRHEVLRTTFSTDEKDNVIQLVSSTTNFHLPIIDLRHLAKEPREVEAQSLTLELARKPFDLERGPLLRPCLLRLDEDEYILSLTVHHTVIDGWSWGILLHELASLYRSSLEGSCANLPELPVQYGDYAQWQQERMDGDRLAELLAYWKRQLGDAPAILELPTDFPRPAVQTYSGNTESLFLPKNVLNSLEKLAVQEGATLFMVLLAAYNILLSRYARQDDLVVATAVAGRDRSEIEGLIGLFVNTLPLRTTLSGNPSFRQLVRQVREVTLGAYSHQELPFEKLVAEMRTGPSLSYSPVFQAMFILQNAPRESLDFANLGVTPLEVTSGTAKTDLLLTAVPKSDGMRLGMTYNVDLFRAATIQSMLSQFSKLVTSAAENSDKPISELDLLGSDERTRITVDWNQTTGDIPLCCIHELFEQQVKRLPQKTALVFDNQKITYSALDKRANQLAHYLQKHGVVAGVPVGLCVDRSIDLIVGILGILKSGGAYLPLDPTYPEERIAFMISDARPPIVITQSALSAKLLAVPCKTIEIDADWELIALENQERPGAWLGNKELCYIIYTSGSTGEPKGVQLEHRNVVNFLNSVQRIFAVDERDTYLGLASMSFDASVLDFFLPLSVGATLVLLSRDDGRDPRRVVSTVARNDVTAMHATPSVWRMLLDVGWTGSRRLRILSGGEALSWDLAKELLPRCSSLWNLYGPTETAVYSTIQHVTLEDGAVLVGRPIDNTSVYILDPQHNPTPVGVPGEIYIGGAGLGRGYLNRPKLTSERFVRDPFRTESGARMYQTGDLGRFRADGAIECLGRLDNQIKLRGFRIELGEIETALMRHPAVQQAVVALREDAPNDKRLVAYIIAQGSEPSQEELRLHLKKRLPEYMVPNVFVTLQSFPLTPNGKLDRKALPKAGAPHPEMQDTYVAPETTIQKELAEIWSNVLLIEKVGIQDNFFALGGHSLAATRVISRIQKHLNWELPLRSIFEYPTIAELAKKVEAVTTNRTEPPAISALPRHEGGATPSPLSFAQQRLWVLDRLEPNSPTYNVPFVLRLTGPLNVGALESALNEVVRRHEVLRTEFHSRNGEPLQVVLANAPVSVTIVDLRTVPSAQREAEAMRLAIAESRKPFGLSRGPLLRASLLRLADSEHILLITVHHIAFDGWSMATLLAEVSQLYGSAVRGEPSRLPELPCQYGDFAAWQRHLLQGERLEQQLSYWKRQLAGAPSSVDLPTDRPRGPIQTFQGRSQTIVMSGSLLQRLRDLSRAQDVTLFMTLLAGFNVLLSRYSGQDDLVVGTPIAGRSRPELEKLIGLFVNTLVLRTDVSGNPSFNELLGRVRETAMGAYAHQDLPFERLVEELRPARDMSRNPLFQIMFGLHNMPKDEWQLQGLTLAPFPVERGTEKFDLSVSLVEKANGLKATFSYNTDLFDGSTITRMMKHFQKLLEELVADPIRSIAEFSLLMDAERHEVLFRFNDSAVDYRRDLCLHNFFEAQAERSPHANALVYERERLNYHELNARANRLAHYLQKCGVGPEVPVAICMERSTDMLVGILAILKAGGAYVPLDPAYPRERLAAILEDAKAPILVTQASLVDILPPHTAQVVRLDADWPKIAAESDKNPVSNVKPENLSYVLFTSGSTGRPKGVAIQHSSAAMLIQWAQNVFLPEEIAGTLFSTSMCFDLSVFEMFVPLSMGGKIIVAQNALSLPKLPAAREVTLINTVPSAIAELVRMDAVPDSVQVVNLAGEALPTSLAQKIYEKTKARKVYNLYGPTEDTTYSTYALVPRKGEVTIGKPLPNTQVYILDAKQQPTPIGVPGELHLAGDGLARGYFGRPDLTAERFLPNPFSSEPGARMYRTGDLARFLPDGNIQYLNRMDNQVKLRGFRIELGEIESVLSQHPSVESAVVIAREDKPGDKRLVAYIVPTGNKRPVSGVLRTFLQQMLPDYMIPAAFVVLDAMPLTPNGKVDRKALPPPNRENSAIEREFVAPRDALEKKLVNIWESLLGIKPIGITDNIFDLGVDSLITARLFARVEKMVGHDLPPAPLFQAPTVESLARLLRHQDAAASQWTSLVAIQSHGTKRALFCVHGGAGTILGFNSLARRLAPERPVYGLQSQGLYGRALPHTSVEEMAAHYIHEMRSVQPRGPYLLGGWCSGGLVAFEMAQQLHSMGERVDLLAMFNALSTPDYEVLNTDPVFSPLAVRLRTTWYKFSGLHGRERLKYVAGKLRQHLAWRKKRLRDQAKVLAKRLTSGLRRRLYRYYLDRRRPLPDMLRNSYFPYINMVAERCYQHQPYPGTMVIFRDQGPYPDPYLGWTRFVQGEIEAFEIPVSVNHHRELMQEPAVRTLAERLEEYLSRSSAGGEERTAQTRPSGPGIEANVVQ